MFMLLEQAEDNAHVGTITVQSILMQFNVIRNFAFNGVLKKNLGLLKINRLFHDLTKSQLY